MQAGLGISRAPCALRESRLIALSASIRRLASGCFAGVSLAFFACVPPALAAYLPTALLRWSCVNSRRSARVSLAIASHPEPSVSSGDTLSPFAYSSPYLPVLLLSLPTSSRPSPLPPNHSLSAVRFVSRCAKKVLYIGGAGQKILYTESAQKTGWLLLRASVLPGE